MLGTLSVDTCNFYLVAHLFSICYQVIFRKRVRVFHRGFKHEKTDESTRPQAECFYCFRVFETPMKTKHEFLKLLLKQKKISLNYHLNKVSQFNYYI